MSFLTTTCCYLAAALSLLQSLQLSAQGLSPLPSIQISRTNDALELSYQLPATNGFFLLLESDLIQDPFQGDTLRFGVLSNAFTSSFLLSPDSQQSFYSIGIEPGINISSLPDTYLPIDLDDPPEEGLYIHVIEAPVTFNVGQTFSLSADILNGDGELQSISGRLTLSVVDADGVPLEPSYRLVPASLPVTAGEA